MHSLYIRFDFNGLDDIEIGAQFDTYSREGLATSLRLSYVVDSQLDNQAIDILSGGDKFEARGLIGQSRETLLGDFFYDAQFALRTESFDKVDQTQAALTLGYKPTQRWLFMAQSYAILSAKEMNAWTASRSSCFFRPMNVILLPGIYLEGFSR